MTFAYRIVLKLAVMVIAGVIPVLLLAKKRKATYSRKAENLKEVVTREERQRTLIVWQLPWQNEAKGRWTARLISNLDLWLNLTGYVGFLFYLHMMTLNTPFSFVKGGTAFISGFIQT